MRKCYVDYAKAIGIILVVMGHINFANSNYGIKEWIYAFHMPLFFFATGLVLKEAKLNKEFFIKKFTVLMVPYFIWGMIYAHLGFKNLAYISYGSHNTLTFANTLTSLWFLPAMFIAVIIVQLIFNVIKPNCIRFIAMILLGLIGVMIPSVGRGYPWCADVSVLAAVFIIFGYFYEKVMSNKSTIVATILFIVGFLGTLLFNFNKIEGSSNVLMARRKIGNPFLFFVVAVCGCIMVYSLTRIIAKVHKDSKLLGFIGSNTLAIFATHKPLIKLCEKFFYKFPCPWFVELFVTTVFVLGLVAFLLY